MTTVSVTVSALRSAQLRALHCSTPI